MTTPTLEHLLAKARALEKSRKAIEQTSLSQVERARRMLEARMARFEWRPQASVAIIEDITCTSCGCVSQVFRGFGVLMRRQSDDVVRILTAKGLDEGLPASRYFLHTSTEVCMECLPERGI